MAELAMSKERSAIHPASGRASRRRGRAFEQLVVRILHRLGHEDAERNLEYQPAHAGWDVTYSGRRVSCKCGRHVPLLVYAWAMDRLIETGRVETHTVLDQGILRVAGVSGSGWVRRALGRCDELWCKRPGWPILVIADES